MNAPTAKNRKRPPSPRRIDMVISPKRADLCSEDNNLTAIGFGCDFPMDLGMGSRASLRQQNREMDPGKIVAYSKSFKRKHSTAGFAMTSAEIRHYFRFRYVGKSAFHARARRLPLYVVPKAQLCYNVEVDVLLKGCKIPYLVPEQRLRMRTHTALFTVLAVIFPDLLLVITRDTWQA